MIYHYNDDDDKPIKKVFNNDETAISNLSANESVSFRIVSNIYQDSSRKFPA